uniref:Uncharacterized protein n=1 Tax=Oryza glumipatula TaxID=40148 RepID=A0A0D9Y808_9ORYZ
MKKRVQAFTEGVVLMVCPVLLAVALKRADLKGKGNGSLVVGSITPLAATTLEAGLLPFLCLCVSKNLPLPVGDGVAGLLYRASKLLVHLCAVLLMALAYGILLLIDMNTRNGAGDHESAVHAAGYGAALEDSVDFSAAVTTLLFLGLEGLALEGQSSGACHGLERLFTASLGFTYLTCALGVFVMLRGTVPPPMITGSSAEMRNVVELLNIVLAVAIALVVVLISAAPMREQAWLVFAPLILSFVTWMYIALIGGDGGQVEGLKQPESLELTKVTFTGFLAVAVPTFSNTPVDISTRGFVVLSAAAVMSGLGWRLLAHRMAPSAATAAAANVASFFAHLCVAAAVIPFAMLAVNAINSK